MKSNNCFHCSINTLQLYVIKLSRIELFRIINHRYFYLTKKNGLTVLRKEYKIERTVNNVLSSLLCIVVIFVIIRKRIRFIRYCYWGLHRNLLFCSSWDLLLLIDHFNFFYLYSLSSTLPNCKPWICILLWTLNYGISDICFFFCFCLMGEVSFYKTCSIQSGILEWIKKMD